MQDTTSAVNAALNPSASVSDTSKKTEIADSSKLAINELQSTAAKAPDASNRRLKEFILSGCWNVGGQANVAIHAVETLHTIGDDAKRKNNLSDVSEGCQKTVPFCGRFAVQRLVDTSSCKNSGLSVLIDDFKRVGAFAISCCERTSD